MPDGSPPELYESGWVLPYTIGGAIEHAVAVRGGADHLVVDGALLLEPQRAVGIFGDAEVADLAANLFVRVVRMQQRVHLRGEQIEEDVGAGGGVEVIARAPLLREGIRAGEPHRVEAGERAAGGALAEKEMLLRVRLALIADGNRVHPRVALRDGFDLQEVERETAALMEEARADRTIRCVDVDRRDGEAVDGLSFRERVELHRFFIRGRSRERVCTQDYGKQSRSHDDGLYGRRARGNTPAARLTGDSSWLWAGGPLPRVPRESLGRGT